MRIADAVVLLVAGALSCHAEIEFVQKPNGVIVKVNRKEFTEFRFGGDRHAPYIYPLRTASGKIITPCYADPARPGTTASEDCQKSILVGHHNVNGVEFLEASSSKSKGGPTGRIVFQRITTTIGGHEGILGFVADWVEPDGAVVLTQHGALRFYDDPQDSRAVDVEFLLHANRKLQFADDPNSILGLWLGKGFAESGSGTVANFLGVRGASAINGRRSTWITFEGELDGEKVGVTIMDHPDNYGFPTRWHVTPEGVVYASAFAERSYFSAAAKLVPTVKEMGVTLEAGDEMFFRYRILIHPLSIDRHSCWKQFVLTPPSGFAIPVRGNAK